MRPDDDAAAIRAVVALQVWDERVERFGHMPVTQIPGRDAAAEHGAVILLGIPGQASVLLGKEEFVAGHAPVEVGKLAGAVLHFHQLPDRFVLAWFGDAARGLIAIDLRIVTKMIEAGIACRARLAPAGSTFSR